MFEFALILVLLSLTAVAVGYPVAGILAFLAGLVALTVVRGGSTAAAERAEDR